jgi:hypothetical protein
MSPLPTGKNVIEAVIVTPFGQAALVGLRGSIWRTPALHSRIGRVATIRLAGDALERLPIVLDSHQVARAFIALLPMPIGPLKLGPTRNRTAPKPIARIFRHVFYPFRLLAALRR